MLSELAALLLHLQGPLEFRKGAVCRIDELRADIEHYARMLLGYDWATG